MRQSDITGLIVQRMLLGKDYVQRVCEALPELAEARDPDLRLTEAPSCAGWSPVARRCPPPFTRKWLTEGSTASARHCWKPSVEVHPADQIVEIYTRAPWRCPGVRHDHGPLLFRTHFIRSKTPVGATARWRTHALLLGGPRRCT